MITFLVNNYELGDLSVYNINQKNLVKYIKNEHDLVI